MPLLPSRVDPRIAQHAAQHGGTVRHHHVHEVKIGPHRITVASPAQKAAALKEIAATVAEELSTQMGNEHRWQASSIYDPMDLGYSGF